MRRKQFSRSVLVGLLAVLIVLGTIPGVAAAKTTVGPTVVVDRGETVTDDLTAAGGTILVLGTVEGDVTALAGDVVVSGEVTGDVTALAGRVEVGGTVGGKVTAFGGVTTLSGSVDDGVDAIGGALRVTGDVTGTVDAISVLVAVEDGATVDGRLQTTAVRTYVNGTVGGTAGTAANQSGVDAFAAGSPDSSPTRLPARLGGAFWTAATPPVAVLSPSPLQLLPFGISFLDAYGFFVNLLLGVLLLWVLPRFSTRTASRVVEDPVRTAAFGVAATLVVPVVLLLFGISLFGLPLALAGGAVMLVFWWVGAVYGRFAVGVWLLGFVPRALAYADVDVEPIDNRWAGLLVGLVVVGLLVAIPLLGPVVDTAVAVLGVGALVRVVYDAYRRIERRDRVETDASTSHAED